MPPQQPSELASVSSAKLVGGGLPAVSQKRRHCCRASNLLWETMTPIYKGPPGHKPQAIWKIAVEHVNPDWKRRLLLQLQQQPKPNNTEEGATAIYDDTYKTRCVLDVTAIISMFTGPAFFPGHARCAHFQIMYVFHVISI